MLTRVGLIGNPVAHSLSPRMQNAAFAAAGLDWEYVLLPAEADEVEDTVRGLLDGFAGANVTVPHKAAVLPFLDEFDSFAEHNDAQAASGLDPILIRRAVLESLRAAWVFPEGE